MSLSSLIPIAGAAAGSLAVKAIGNIADGLDFSSMLRRDDSAENEQGESARAPEFVSMLSAGSLQTDLTQLQQQNREMLDQLAQKLRQKLSQAGIDLSQPITLESDGRDGVLEVGAHPQRAEIEGVLQNSPELAGEFQTLSRNMQTLHALQQPNRRSERFQLEMQGNGARALFV